MSDTRNGGYYEIMQTDWQPERPGRFGGDRKSLDVHMHMMEALTRLVELTGHPSHRRRLGEVIDLIVTRMLHPEFGLGYMQFSLDFSPLPAILFETEWGRDAEPADGLARPLDTTSYGHNVEFAWLLLHALEILGDPLEPYLPLVRQIVDHCCSYGIDSSTGGVCVDGPFRGAPRDREKQFWQQAEVLVGLLDALRLFEDPGYWTAFRQLYDYIFEKFVCWSGGGEWFERLDRDGNPIDDALGHAWKINYHTVRAMIQVVHRLDLLLMEKGATLK
ncbi:AGE family epimerase/isomerase, partial [candidate division KSB1 bacterium]|nr:AGE family epimerase/isomerase [candidate division KSB1 bacterium]